jgi:ATP-dependent RNA helicase DDX52/ROK1
MQAIPVRLAGRDLLACAPTGSGKTAAFVIPVLTRLAAPGDVGLRALVLSPTRELAQQLHRQFDVIGHGRGFKTLYLTKANANKTTFGAKSSQRKDVLVATPMRLVTLIKNGDIELKSVEWLVLDEADRLLDDNAGFLDQLDAILAVVHGNKGLCRALFSATMLQGVEQLARTVLTDPIRINIGHRNAAAHSVEQSLLYCGQERGKLLALRQLIETGVKPPVLIFVQSMQRAEQLQQELQLDSMTVDIIHGERSQQQRESVVNRFRSGELSMLICTDLMSRGIDFKGVNFVVNFDCPQSAVSYIHRIGRTGRGGRTGKAVTFFTESDAQLIRSIAPVLQRSGCDVPDWMMRLKSMPKAKRRRVENVPPPRESIAKVGKKHDAKPKSRKQEKRDTKKKNEREAAAAEAKADGTAPAKPKSKKKLSKKFLMKRKVMQESMM